MMASCSSDGGAVEAVKPREGRRVVFEDDFTSTSTIDLQGTGQEGFNWYLDRPFRWGRTPAKDLAVADSVLTIDPSNFSPNCSLLTASPESGKGRSFGHAYVEASIAFDPKHATRSDGWPAFWGMTERQVLKGDLERTMELDFFEAMNPSGKAGDPHDDTWTGTLHDMQVVPDEVTRANFGANTVHRPDVDWTQFHTYGCLWEQGRVVWFMDDKVINQLTFGPDRAPSPNPGGLPSGLFSPLDGESGRLVLILGTGQRYPMRVDWVKVWQ